MVVLRDSDHFHFCDGVEQTHDMFRKMGPMMARGAPSGTNVEAMFDAMKRSDELCPGRYAYAYLQGLGLAHMDAHVKGEPAAADLLSGDIDALLAERGIEVETVREAALSAPHVGGVETALIPLAEIYVDVESLKSLTYYAAWALDDSPEDVALAVSEAKAFASQAITRAGIDAIQLHGAVGYTAEYDVQLYLKRSKWSRPLYGDEDFHHDRIAQLSRY